MILVGLCGGLNENVLRVLITSFPVGGTVCRSLFGLAGKYMSLERALRLYSVSLLQLRV